MVSIKTASGYSRVFGDREIGMLSLSAIFLKYEALAPRGFVLSP
jgi:hypothetical protein